ncbi:MAG: hypothetical protein H8F28_23530 [Fibrella sp.]|nr:hypothetical protein [Armatimonadota bacterium]
MRIIIPVGLLAWGTVAITSLWGCGGSDKTVFKDPAPVVESPLPDLFYDPQAPHRSGNVDLQYKSVGRQSRPVPIGNCRASLAPRNPYAYPDTSALVALQGEWNIGRVQLVFKDYRDPAAPRIFQLYFNVGFGFPDEGLDPDGDPPIPIVVNEDELMVPGREIPVGDPIYTNSERGNINRFVMLIATGRPQKRGGDGNYYAAHTARVVGGTVRIERNSGGELRLRLLNVRCAGDPSRAGELASGEFVINGTITIADCTPFSGCKQNP